ncbi:MAG: CapA family protein [Halobacteria archaeon]|nr:CapA family protein [Halobacteria archaeon]
MPVQSTRENPQGTDAVTLFIAGDVMTGRGIDQILPHPGNSRIFEPYSRSARDYVRLAEQANGPIPRPVDFAYIWGDALALLDEAAPDVRIINLETAVTRRGEPWPGKGIQYRMHPDNIPCLSAAAIDCCVLANNHVLDWGYAGFEETLSSLSGSGLTSVGAGPNRVAAQTPAVFDLPGRGRVLVFAWGLPSSGIPAVWAATARKPGVNLLPGLAENAIRDVTDAVAAHRQAGDVVVVSLHWGGNWGYPIPDEHRRFAHALIDAAAVDLVHGHSSHHPLGIEVYRGKPVIYGCGDLIDDYEGISGHEEFRIDLALLYLVTLERGTGDLRQLQMIPMQRRKFRLNRTLRKDSDWLREVLDRESRSLGARVELAEDHALQLRWG